jgi:nucleoside-diphosphate-sugar epimerase
MTIMVTGAFGFVGLNIVEALLGRGETVVALGLGGVPAEAEADFRDLPGKLVAIEADVTTEGVIAGAMAAHALDRLIHTAAITAGYEREKATPAKVFEVNLLGTVAAIQAARDNGVKKIVSFSSSSVYGDGADAVEIVDEATTWPRKGTPSATTWQSVRPSGSASFGISTFRCSGPAPSTARSSATPGLATP